MTGEMKQVVEWTTGDFDQVPTQAKAHDPQAEATQGKKLPTRFWPFNFELMSHGGSEARPVARWIFKFDNSDLAQAREGILEFMGLKWSRWAQLKPGRRI